MGFVYCPVQYMIYYEEPLVIRVVIWMACQAFKLVPKKFVYRDDFSEKASSRMVSGPN